MPDDSKLETIPVGSLGIVAHKSCTGLGEKVDHYLVNGELTETMYTKTTLFSTDMKLILT